MRCCLITSGCVLLFAAGPAAARESTCLSRVGSPCEQVNEACGKATRVVCERGKVTAVHCRREHRAGSACSWAWRGATRGWSRLARLRTPRGYGDLHLRGGVLLLRLVHCAGCRGMPRRWFMAAQIGSASDRVLRRLQTSAGLPKEAPLRDRRSWCEALSRRLALQGLKRGQLKEIAAGAAGDPRSGQAALMIKHRWPRVEALRAGDGCALRLALARTRLPVTIKRAPIGLIFTNRTTRSLRLLDEHTRGAFDPRRFGIWFELDVRLQLAAGVKLQLPAGLQAGKISMRRPMRYVDVPAGKPHRVTLDLARIVALVPGTYTVTVTYRNQYGRGCFKGAIESDRFLVQIGPGAPQINKHHARKLASMHGMFVHHLSFPASMMPPVVREEGGAYVVEWRVGRKGPGFNYVVRVDRKSGRILSARKGR